MTRRPRSLVARLDFRDELNFLLTNRIPRNALTWLVGRISKSENPVVRDVSIAVWRAFAELDLSEARTTHFRSMHDCFTRQLREGARPIDPDPRQLTSPCDGIVGAHGRITDDVLLQAKDSTYSLTGLLGGDQALADQFHGGQYLTLRLTSSMYHRFHAPQDCRVEQVTYISGEAYNVNPPTLRRIDRLYCRNERAVLRCRLGDGAVMGLVPVAAVLVASIRLHFIDVLLHLRYRGPNAIPCDAPMSKGEEMGWFEHGSTIILLLPAGYSPRFDLTCGLRVRVGEALFTGSA